LPDSLSITNISFEDKNAIPVGNSLPLNTISALRLWSLIDGSFGDFTAYDICGKKQFVLGTIKDTDKIIKKV
jgi:hypothetical protein